MIRRTRAQAEITRELLLDAAEKVFRERGATRASLAEVAAAAGMTRGAVYWHFKDKADLFAAMCTRASSPLNATLAATAGAGAQDPLGALRDFMAGALRHLARDPRAQAVFEIVHLKTELCGELGAVAGHRDCERIACLSQIEQRLREAVDLGHLAADTDAALATQLLHGCLGGLMREWLLSGRSYDLARAAPQLIECVIAGIVAQPPRRVERIRPHVRPRAGTKL